MAKLVGETVRKDSALSRKHLQQLQDFAKGGNKILQACAKKGEGLWYHGTNQFEKAERVLSEALQTAKESGSNWEIMECSYYLGESETAMGKYELALQLYFNALDASDKLKYDGETTNVSAIYKSINKLYQYTGQYDRALEYAYKSLKVDLALGDSVLIGKSLNNLCAAWAYLGRADSALKYALMAIHIKKRMGANPASLVSSYINVSNLYIGQENYDSAFHYLYAAKSIAEREHDERGACKIYPSIAIAWYKLEKYDSAIYYYNLSQPIALKVGLYEAAVENYYELSRCYFQIGDYKNAYENNMKFAVMKDSLLKADNLRHMNEMETKFETVKKDKELLEKDTEISRKNSQRNYFIIGLLVFVLLAGFLYRNYRQQQKANTIIAAQKEEVERQKELVDEKNREVSDSIHYAKRIQGALLAGEHLLKKHLPEHFVLYKPKDIVSGDFYWAHPLPEENDTSGKLVLVTADCTGHGVPGAFMSLLNISKLNETINEKKLSSPDLVLNNVRAEIIRALNPEGSTEQSNDGMDCVCLVIDLTAMKLDYAAAHNPFYIVRNGELIVCKADKMAVGRSPREHEPFTRNTQELMKGDVIYTLTDGYADQFGGEKGKKFKYKQLEDLLISIHKKPMAEQRTTLETSIDNWRGKLEQVDDILIIGIRV